MHYYYKYSILTIAADDAIGDHEGFLLRPRQLGCTLAIILFQIKQAKTKCHALIRQKVEYVGQELKATHLSQRAWTLQEYLLAPRTLHFGSEHLSWECQWHRTTEADITPRTANESEPACITKRFFLQPNVSADCALVRSRPNMAEYFEPRWRWYNIVEAYCQRDLTFHKDRPTAILGIAQEIQVQTKMTYLSGLWAEDLHFRLLWQVDGRGSHLEMTPTVPSWSWTSLHIEHSWGQSINPLAQIYYGARQFGIDVDACFRAEVLGETTARDSYAGGVFNGLRLRGQVLSLADWGGQSKPFFRAYWQPPFSHSGGLLWRKATRSDTLICSFDEDTNPQSDTEDESESDSEATTSTFMRKTGPYGTRKR